MADSDNISDKITSLLLRINTIEQQIQQLQLQLVQVQQQYVLTNINDLHLQGIRGTAERIETDIKDLKISLLDVGQKLAAQVTVGQKRESNAQQGQDELKIRVLWGIVSTVITVLVALLIAYITHFIR